MFKNMKVIKISNQWTMNGTRNVLRFFFLTLSINLFNVVKSERNIGCLFAPNLCIDPLELCYDDNIFGQCLLAAEIPEIETQQSFSLDQILTLKNMLEELNAAGLDWSHPFTQCRMQKAISAMQNVMEFDESTCADYAPIPEILDYQPYTDSRAQEAFIHFVSPEIQVQPYNIRKKSQVISVDSNDHQEDVDNMVRDLENRIKLRRLLFEHEKQMREQQLRESLDDSYQQNEEQEKSFDSIQIPSGSAFTEGGVVYTSESDENTPSLFDNFMGFTRHERLDVKKPGPQPPNPYKSDDNIIPSRPKINSTELKVKKLVHDMKDDHANFSVDNEFAHVILKNSLDSWSDGERIVQALGEMLNLQNYLTHIRVDRQEVTFKVEQNPERKTAFDVAKAINDGRFKNNLSRRMGVLVMRAGVGDKVKDYENEWKNTKIEALSEDMNMKMIIIVMIIISTALAIVICLGVLILYKRIMRRREKYNNLHCNLTKADSSSKDYQELCRARMASKNEVSTTRMASLSKENDKPPSSRSSTSSWSEEPAGFNMDISTGHMVLSYMEDHLKNKGRLQREWEALCRYEAEPNSREAALHEDTICFNRSEGAVPYDHSRVVLNHLANANGIDYINASTITDVDPRAPAYIVAQSPLESTKSHFWQMIWEQGSVVIVTLCRLQENGESVCSRYWPEEASEIYHIYEVHLVSEHIWTDDYLVRSFYLKNLKTGETRTVTQFHFLSWPQNSVPISAKVLLEFRRKVNKSYRGRSCPIVVHSSLGLGRAGAYVLLDLVLGRMNKGAREIDIAATLEHLRDQRSGLVETKAQFEFVLTAVAEEVHSILKALPSGQTEKRDSDTKENPTKTSKDSQEKVEGDNKSANEK